MLNTHWNLEVLYKSFDDPQLSEDFTWIGEETAALTALAGADFDCTACWLKEMLRRLSDLLERFEKASSYVFLTLAVEATHEAAMACQDKINNLAMELTLLENAFSRRLAAVDGLDALVEADAELKPFAFAVAERVNSARHMLPEALEGPVLTMQLTGGRAWEALRNVLDGTAMVDYTGERLPLPQVRGMAYDPDPKVRKSAYEAELAAYPAYENSMAAALNAIKGEAMAMGKMKGYATVLDEVLDISRMDRATLDALIGAIEKYLPAFRKYLKAKARVLGHKNGLPFYDLFAPVGSAQKSYTYDEAHAYLVDILGRFSPKMGEFIDRAFCNRWMDALPAPGKGGGAFCAFIYALGESRILSNFTGSFSDVSTLAHELGHGYHGECLKNEPILNVSYPMPLAETASIFNETLVTQAALKEADDEEAFTLLESELMEATQVIVDIYSRYHFETALFAGRADHSLSVSELKENILAAQRAAYGDGLDPEYLHPYMWQCKSHYYSADLHFYNFPYAFGLLFGRGVYALYEKEGEAFVPKYDELLKGAGNHSVADAAALMGIDVRDQAFWETSLESIARDIEHFVQMAEKR